MDVSATYDAMQAKAAAVAGGDTREIEAMLISQAVATQAMFCELARRAALNMGTNIDAMETYMRLALKAQAQSSSTLERLAEIKNPRPVFINPRQVNHSSGPQQVNNAAGPQQVNNGDPAAPSLPAPPADAVHSAHEPTGQSERACVEEKQ